MIYELQFSYIRSYGENTNISFALPTEGKIGLTVLVGKNNAGKSTILRLLSDAFDDKPNMIFDKLDRNPDNDPDVKIKFSSNDVCCQLKLSKSASAYFKKNVSNVQDGTNQSVPGVGTGGGPFVAFVPSRRPWNDSFNSEAKTNLLQFENSARASRNPNQLADLGSQLNSLIASGDKGRFDSLLKAIIPEINDWTTDRISGQDKIVYQSKSGVEHAINDSGDGVVSLFRICHAICKYPPNTPLLLDEPELSLHPDAQKRLYNLIVKVAQERQVIVSTHSPHFVEWRHIANGAKVCRVAQDDGGISKIFTPNEESFSNILRFTEEDPKNRKLYDYLAKEMFFQSGIVFLEGQEDVHLVSRFMEIQDLDVLPLFSYGAGGSGNIRHLLQLAKELGLRAAGVYDGNKVAEYERARDEFFDSPQIQCFLLNKDDIRDKHKRDGSCDIDGKCQEIEEISIEGYFDRSWNPKPEAEDELLPLLREISEHLGEQP